LRSRCSSSWRASARSRASPPGLSIAPPLGLAPRLLVTQRGDPRAALRLERDEGAVGLLGPDDPERRPALE
jgi:hypothetical protein